MKKRFHLKKSIFASVFVISLFAFSGLRFADAALITDISSDARHTLALATAFIEGVPGNDRDSGSNPTNVNSIPAFGFNDWDFLQKVDLSPFALKTDTDIGLTITGGGDSSNFGTFEMNAGLVSGFSDLMIALKHQNEFNLYLIPTTATSGYWTSSMVGNGNGLSHFSVYGRGSDPVILPEPTTILLMGIGLAGLVGVGVRRKMKSKAVEKS